LNFQKLMQGHQENAGIKPKLLADNTAVIVFDPMSPRMHVGRLSSVHLGPADQARFHFLPHGLIGDICSRVRAQRGCRQTKDISSQNLQQPRQFVQAPTAEHWTNPVHTLIVATTGPAAPLEAPAAGAVTMRKHSIGGWNLSLE
jgi:hypothetical protein